MRIAYLSIASPFNRSSWSGIPWYSYKEVKSRFADTHVVDTPMADHVVTRLAPMAHLGVLVSREPLLARTFSRYVDRQLEAIKPDVVVAVNAAHKIAYLNHRCPIIYVADALFSTIIDYYDQYKRLSIRTRRVGEQMQRSLINRCDLVMMASQWAADMARRDYGVPRDRLLTVPYGANLDYDPGYRPPLTKGPLRLLFTGYAWQRKGGPLALQIWRALRDRTGNAELHIIGCHPPEAERLEGVHVHGILNKSDPKDYGRFVDLFAQSSFFLMPSHQEAFGLVFCETAAFGRPAVAMHTGGVPTIVQDGRTGILLPPGSPPEAYADRILATWQDPVVYAALSHAARADFETRLNWQAWGASLEDAVARIGSR